MRTAAYQIRECKNPNCRLRYPLVKNLSFDSRCPRCLGETVAVFEGEAAGHENANRKAPATCPRLEALVDNVRSALNVGSIFRTAEGLGFDHIYLAGITPTPQEPGVKKTSLGSEGSLPWSHHCNALELLPTLASRGYKIWALESLSHAITLDLGDMSWAEAAKAVLVVGNEVTGIDPGIISCADRVVRLPMLGRKSSFNAAVAFAIAAYAFATTARSQEPRDPL